MLRSPLAALLSSACLLASACGGGHPVPPAVTPDGGVPPAGDSPDAGSTPPPSLFAVSVAIKGAGRVTSAPAGIDCGTNCSNLFEGGTAVALLPTPGEGFRFDGWGGGCTGPGACSLATGATVYATFVPIPPPPKMYHVTIELDPAQEAGGSITSSPGGIHCGVPGGVRPKDTSCGADFPEGGQVTFTATPASGWITSGFSYCNNQATCTITISKDLLVAKDLIVVGTVFTKVPACTFLALDATTPQQYVHPQFQGFCGGGMGDANATLTFYVQHETGSRGDHGIFLDFVTTNDLYRTSSRLLAEQAAGTGRGLVAPLQQPNGTAAVTFSGWPDNLWQVVNWDAAGHFGGHENQFRADNLTKVADFINGQVLIAGKMTFDISPGAPKANLANLYEANGRPMTSRWNGAQYLASKGAVVGAGVDALQRSLIITDGSKKFGAGAISAEWFGADGTPLTGEFVLLTGFVPGSATWFEASPLLDGGLAIRVVDSSSNAPYSARYILVVPAGSSAPQAAPDWMASRKNARLQITRDFNGYVVLPDHASGVPCSQHVEVLAPDGTLCASREYPLADGTCDTYDMTLANDGTVIQQLPLSMETQDPVSAAHTCTWRWWVGAVRRPYGMWWPG